MSSQKIFRRKDDALDRLYDNGRKVLAVFLDDAAQGIEIVVRRNQDVIDHIGR